MRKINAAAVSVLACAVIAGALHPEASAVAQPLSYSSPSVHMAGVDQYKVLPDFEDIKGGVVRISINVGRGGAYAHNGTGFVIAPDVVVTNDHVAQNRKVIQIGYVLGSEINVVEADVIGTSEKADLAFFRTKRPLPVKPLPIASFAPPVGAQVGAIGYPGTVDLVLKFPTKFASLTGGNINQVEGHSIFHSALLFPGNSGGPLMLRTECGSVVVGVNTHIVFTSNSAPLYYGSYGANGLAALARELNVDLKTIDDINFCDRIAKPEPAAEQTAKNSAPPTPAPPIPAPKPPLSAARPVPAPAASAPSSDKIERMILLAEEKIKIGEIASARAFLKMPCEAGHLMATLMMARTYDPRALSVLGVIGLRGDVKKAQEYYEKAYRLGSQEAKAHLEDMQRLETAQGMRNRIEAKPSPSYPEVIPVTPSLLLNYAEVLLNKGDVVAARTFLELLSKSNDPQGVFLLAQTYDPVCLKRWRTVGLSSDANRARALYDRAINLGFTDASGWPKMCAESRRIR